MPNDIDSLELLVPTTVFRNSYVGLVQEFVECRERLVPFVLGVDYSDFPKMVGRLRGFSVGREVPEGFTAHSTYWLVRNGVEVVGVSNFRHTLTPRLERDGGHIGYGVRPSTRGKGYGSILLAKTLAVAKSWGLAKVLLTVRKTNIASIQVIVRNGGVLESEAHIREKDEILQKYWIIL
jgi:predicted acetyltransferase